MSDNANQPANPIKLNNRVDDGSGNIVIEECDDYFHGLTKREHFAGLAPSDVPDWFEFQADFSNIVAPDLTQHQLDMMGEYRAENYDISEEDFKVGSDAHSLMSSYECKLEREQSKQRYFAWKVYHSDELLAELDKVKA